MAQDRYIGPIPAPTEVMYSLPPLEVFRGFAEMIDQGAIQRHDLVTIKTDPLNGERSMSSPLGNKRVDVWNGFLSFLSEITGSTNGFELLQTVIQKEKPEGKFLDYPLSLFTWKVASKKEGLSVGLEIKDDGKRELSRTYYIFKPKIPLTTRIKIGLGKLFFDPV